MGNSTKVAQILSFLNGLKMFLNLIKILWKSCDEESDQGYSLEVNVQYPEKQHKLDNDLPFLPERMKIEKVKKLVAKLHNKTENLIHIRNLNQTLNRGLVLKKVHKIIKLNQKASLKLYIDINLDLRKNPKNDYKKDFFKLIHDSFLEKL